MSNDQCPSNGSMTNDQKGDAGVQQSISREPGNWTLGHWSLVIGHLRTIARPRTCLAVVVAIALLASAAVAWHGPGHVNATTLAVGGLPREVPAFFRAGASTIAENSKDPDLFRLPLFPELREQEAPEHYLDLELLAGVQPPPGRYAFVRLCAERKLDPSKVGLLPYAVTEWTQRLTIALAEHRRWPDDRDIQRKCLVYAGILAHYAQDLCNPLHTTIHYDGRPGPDGKPGKTGLHNRVDALLGRFMPADETVRAVEPEVFDKLMPAVLAELGRSHALVAKVLDMDKDIPAEEQARAADSPARKLGEERLAAAARFTASLYLTAWRQSEKLALPEWHTRPASSQPATQPK